MVAIQPINTAVQDKILIKNNILDVLQKVNLVTENTRDPISFIKIDTFSVQNQSKIRSFLNAAKEIANHLEITNVLKLKAL